MQKMERRISRETLIEGLSKSLPEPFCLLEKIASLGF